VIVVDASVLAPALGDDGDDGDRARQRLSNETLAASELIDLEVSSVLRRLSLDGRIPARRAELAMSDLVALPLRRVSAPRLASAMLEPSGEPHHLQRVVRGPSRAARHGPGGR
jgi:predicted nucleic acid-binding protein